jgi:hypothetical protein
MRQAVYHSLAHHALDTGNGYEGCFAPFHDRSSRHDNASDHDMFVPLVAVGRTSLLGVECKAEIASPGILDPRQSRYKSVLHDDVFRQRNVVAVQSRSTLPKNLVPSPLETLNASAANQITYVNTELTCDGSPALARGAVT